MPLQEKAAQQEQQQLLEALTMEELQPLVHSIIGCAGHVYTMLAKFGVVLADGNYSGTPGTKCHSLLATLLYCQRAARSLLKYLAAAAGEAKAAATVTAAGGATAAAVTAAGEPTAAAAVAAAAGEAAAAAATAAGKVEAHGPACGVGGDGAGTSSSFGGGQLLQLRVEEGCSQQQELERRQHRQQEGSTPTAVAAAAAAGGACELLCMEPSSNQRVTGLQLAVNGNSALGEVVQQQLQVSLSDLAVMVVEVLIQPAAKEMSSEQVNELVGIDAAAGPGRGDTFRAAAAAAGVLRAGS